MNWRYFYIASVVALSYVLFLSWNAEKEIKQEVAEATAIDFNKNQQVLPAGETEDFIEIQNNKLTPSSKINAPNHLNETNRLSETSQESVPEKQQFENRIQLRSKRDLPAIYQREQVRYSFC